jgi:hypothetical protein
LIRLKAIRQACRHSLPFQITSPRCIPYAPFV